MNIADYVISMMNETAIPMALYICGSGIKKPWGFAVGAANKNTQEPLTVDTPFRIASNTKTFTAAAILRLWEDGKIDLDTPISHYINPNLFNILEATRYNSNEITVRHLLNHSSGLYDHADREYIVQILRNPTHKWTREAQVKRAVSSPQKAREIGIEYFYSDTGYILLGDIIERITGKPLGLAVREHLNFDQAEFTSTWWEGTEPVPLSIPERAHQYLGRHDTTNFHYSMDSFGGGGLIMSSRDLARWMAMLFEGEVFKNTATLHHMKATGTHVNAEDYRLGLMYHRIGACEIYSHTGFWGSAAYYCPQKNISVAGFTNICELRPQLLGVMENIIKVI